MQNRHRNRVVVRGSNPIEQGHAADLGLPIVPYGRGLTAANPMNGDRLTVKVASQKPIVSGLMLVYMRSKREIIQDHSWSKCCFGQFFAPIMSIAKPYLNLIRERVLQYRV
jgi:hypothetical protein